MLYDVISIGQNLILSPQGTSFVLFQDQILGSALLSWRVEVEGGFAPLMVSPFTG